MFLCQPCLEKEGRWSDWMEFSFSSYGPCEDCRQTKVCYDA